MYYKTSRFYCQIEKKTYSHQLMSIGTVQPNNARILFPSDFRFRLVGDKFGNGVPYHFPDIAKRSH